MSGQLLLGPWSEPRGCPCATCQGKHKHPAPPTEVYLAVRAMLGIPSQPAQAELGVIQQGCPWCGATTNQPCYVAATGRRLTQPHEARRHIDGGEA